MADVWRGMLCRPLLFSLHATAQLPRGSTATADNPTCVSVTPACLRLARTQVSSRRRPNETDAEWARRQEAARQEVNSHLLVFIHGSLQALTAIGLLQVGCCCLLLLAGGVVGRPAEEQPAAGLCPQQQSAARRCSRCMSVGAAASLCVYISMVPEQAVSPKLPTSSHDVCVCCCPAAPYCLPVVQLYPFRPRTVGLLGTLASALNCYFLLPAFPQRPKAVADKPAAAAAAGALPAFTGADGKLVAKVA